MQIQILEYRVSTGLTRLKLPDARGIIYLNGILIEMRVNLLLLLIFLIPKWLGTNWKMRIEKDSTQQRQLIYTNWDEQNTPKPMTLLRSLQPSLLKFYLSSFIVPPCP